MGMPTVSMTCPIGDCPVTMTRQYGENAREPGFMTDAKKLLRKDLEKAHKDGTHKKLVKEARNG